MSELELKPCPFCGGEADEYEGDYGNGVYCMQCGAMVGEPIHEGFRVDRRVTYQQASEAWNMRATLRSEREKALEELVQDWQVLYEDPDYGDCIRLRKRMQELGIEVIDE